MTTVSGTGTFTSWRIGYRGPRFDHDPVSRTNLVLQSEGFDSATWDKSTSPANWQGTGSAPAVTANDEISPRGDLTAERIVLTLNSGTSVNDRSGFSQVLSATVGVNYSVSVYIKPLDSTTDLQLINSNIGIATFGTILTRNVVDAGSGWKRIITTYVATSTFGTFRFQIVGGSGINQFTGLIWGAQVEAGSTATSYIPTTTAPVTIHDCRGLLIEEGRTNSLQHSANFKNTTSSNYWENPSATTVTVDQIASPDGGMNADLLSTSATAFDCFFRRANIWAGSTQYTYSVFLKQGLSNHRYVGLYIGAGVSALKFPFFDFNNPTVVQIPSGTMVGTINSTRVDAYPNGWYRVIVTFTTAATPATTNCGAYISTSDGTLPSSSAAGLDAYIWGIQSELGSFATSYIPTTTGTLARSADVCTITGGDFNNFYNQSEGTMFAESLKTTGPASNSFICGPSNGSFNEFIDLRYLSDTLLQSVTNHLNVTQFAVNRAYTLNAITRQAIAYALNDAAYCAQGGVVTVDVPPYTPPVVTLFHIGSAGSGVLKLNGCVRAIRYYRKRLPDAKLQALTV
jgi:hypothetical protein